MATAPRVDFPNAIHHVTNRGVRGMDIFEGSTHRKKFLEYVDHYKQEYEITILSYALMSNHFHILLKSHQGRISNFMNVLQSQYATWFNSQKGRESGRLFQSRFHSDLVQTGQYFATAIRYILTNPHRSGLANKENYFHSWTSLSEWKENDGVTNWSEVFNLLEEIQPDHFIDYVFSEFNDLDTEVKEIRREIRNTNVLGNDEFLESVLQKKEKEIRDSEIRGGPIDPEIIIEEVCRFFEIDSESILLESAPDKKNSKARYTSFYLLRTRSHKSVAEIAELFSVSEASITKGIKKFHQFNKDGEFQEFLEEWNFRFKD